MSGYLIAAIVLTAIGAYLFAGWRIAVSQLPRLWAKARKHWHSAKYVRSSVRWQMAWMLLFWPSVPLFWSASLCFRSVARRIGQVIDAGDPVLLARKLAERDRRIAQLEREAGIRP